MHKDQNDTRPLVLIIDDDDAMRDAVVAALDGFGYRTIGAEDGAAALRLMATEHPVALVLDLYMPEMDGFETMSALKASASKVPIVVISGGIAGEQGDLLPMALDFGAAAILRKPFETAELDAVLRKVIGR